MSQDLFGARDQASGRDDFVDQSDPVGLLGADHLAGENELKCATPAYQPREALRPPTTGNQAQLDLGLPESCALHRNPQRARHRGLTASAEGKAVDRRDYRLAQVLDEIQHRLSETAGLLRFKGGDVGELTDIGAGNERFVTRTGENDPANAGIAPRIFEGRKQICPGRRVQCVENLRTIERYIRDTILLLVEDVLES